jgi:hypothetical protein
LIQLGKPKPPLDGVDLIGSDDHPYEYAELVPDRLWHVRYHYMLDPDLIALLQDILGINLTDSSILDTI